MTRTDHLGRIPKWAHAPGSSVQASNLKKPVTGIGPRNAGMPSTRVDDVGFVVADVLWSDLQPTATGPITITGTELAVAKALRYSSSHPDPTLRGTPVPIRLRVHTGRYAPAWVKAQVGSITLITTDQKPGQPAPGGEYWTVPRWWKQELLDAWGNFMHALAVLYDGDSQVREIASNPATTEYDEPMQRGTKKVKATAGPNIGYTNVQVIYEAMLADGVSSADSQVALASGVVVGPSKVDAAAVLWPTDRIIVNGGSVSRWASLGWATTRYYLAHNPFQQWRVLNSSTDPAVFDYAVQNDPAGWVTKTAVPGVAGNMKNRVMLGNNSLRVPTNTPGALYPPMYEAEIKAASGNSYQTATTNVLTPAYQTVHPGATDAQALDMTLKVGLGMITKAADPENLIVMPAGSTVTAMRARSIELPPGWPSLLTSAQCAAYNTAAAVNPTGD